MSNHSAKRGCLVRRAALLFFVSVLLSLVSLSCSTPPAVNEFLLPDGRQQYFIRPVDVKGKNLSASVDFTVRVKDGKIVDPVTMNYTLKDKPLGETRADKVSLKLYCGDKEYELSDVSTLFKSIQPVQARFSSTISPEFFTEMILSDGMFSIKFISPSNGEITLACPKIRKSLSDMQAALYFE